MSKAKKKVKKKQKATKTITWSDYLPWMGGAVLLTLLAFIPVFGTDLINYDDELYITQNPLIQSFDIKGLFSQFYKSQYSPLAMLIMACQFKLGMSTGMLKFVSVLIHLANTALVFAVVYQLFKKLDWSFFVAAFFGVCVLQVESVAWLTASMKIGMYALYFLLALLSYLLYLDRKNHNYLWASILYFIAACLCKEQAVALAPTLVAIDYLKKRDIFSKKVITEKIPFFIIALIFGIITLQASQSFEAKQLVYDFGFGERILFALYALGMYFVKMIAPFNLSMFYTYPIKGAIPVSYYIYTLICLGVLGLTFWSFKRKDRTLSFALLFFFINIGLTIFTQILSVRDVIAADRYVYIPAIGWFIAIVYLLDQFVLPKVGKPLQYGALAFLVATAFLSFQRANLWENSYTIFSDVIEKGQLANGQLNPYLALPYNNRGIYQRRNKQYEGALADFNKAIAASPTNAKAYQNRGNIYFNQNKDNLALQDYNKTLSLQPNNEKALSSRGAIFAKQGQISKALEDINRAIEIDPTFTDAYSNRALIYMQQQDMAKAIVDFTTYLKYQPVAADVYSSRGVCYAQSGQTQLAIKDHTKAIQLSPNTGAFYVNRAYTYRSMQNTAAAVQDLQTAKSYGANIPPELASSLGM